MQQISESVQSMRNIVHDDLTISGQTFSLARPIPAFASNALLPMDFIIKLKQNPPNRISLIHAVILMLRPSARGPSARRPSARRPSARETECPETECPGRLSARGDWVPGRPSARGDWVPGETECPGRLSARETECPGRLSARETECPVNNSFELINYYHKKKSLNFKNL